MVERELYVLTKQQRVARRNIRISEQVRESRHIVVCQELRGLLGQKASGDEHVKLLASIEVEDIADPIQHFAADPPVS